MTSEVYLNDKFIGYVEDPEKFVNSIREARRRGIEAPGRISLLLNNSIFIIQPAIISDAVSTKA